MSAEMQIARDTGYSLVELLIAAVVTLLIVSTSFAALLSYQSFSARQVARADVQQTLRTATTSLATAARLSGRGGVPLRGDPSSASVELLAIDVRDNVATGSRVAGEPVAPGTDVLIVRGVFGEALQLGASREALEWNDTLATGRAVVPTHDRSGLPQRDDALEECFEESCDHPLVVRSAGDPGIVRVVTPAAIDFVAREVTGDGRIDPGEGEWVLSLSLADEVSRLGSAAPWPEATPAESIGFLDEHHYFVHTHDAVDGASTRQLTRAIVAPGSDEPVGGSRANARIHLVDHVVDLQVAIGRDLDGDGVSLASPADDAEWWLDAAGETLESLEAPDLVRLTVTAVTPERLIGQTGGDVRPAENASDQSIDLRGRRSATATILVQLRNLRP